MKKKIEVFFDYLCPYCDKGIRQFIEILPEYNNIEVEWIPCEAHPRPEYSSIYSDIAIEAMYCLKEQNGDLIKFHIEVFNAWFKDRKRIDDINILSSIAEKCGGSKEKTINLLIEKKYKNKASENNEYAWSKNGLYAVPSYICGDKTALSKDGILVPIKKVRKLIEQ